MDHYSWRLTQIRILLQQAALPQRCPPQITLPPNWSAQATITPGHQIVFTDQNQQFTGLRHLIFTVSPRGLPVAVVDNHHQVFWAWRIAQKNNLIPTPATVVHLDAHFDQTPWNAAAKLDQDLTVSNYLAAARHYGMIDRIQYFVETPHFTQLPQGEIVNLDLDLFAPTMDHLPLQTKITTLQAALISAKILTIATSPGFIDQSLSLPLAKLILEYV